jgi:ssDNA-binding replication factor A large subunit
MQNYELLIERIAKSAGLEKDEVERKVEAKKAKLSGLISKEGAAQIIAAELGISFENADLKISELMLGMRKVNVIGKMMNLSPVREYEKNGRSGKVVNFMLADDSGNCRVVLWDTNHIALIENGEIKEGDVVEIRNASMRDTEVHLSGFSEFKKSAQEMDEVVTEKVVSEATLDSAVNGQSIKARAVVVSMYEPRFYSVCPQCNKKVTSEGEDFVCAEHGKVDAKERAILNLTIDDSTECMRTVLFSDAINTLIPETELKDAAKFEAFKMDMLGTEVYVSGRVNRNSLFNNLEIVGNSIEKVDVDKLISDLESN